MKETTDISSGEPLPVKIDEALIALFLKELREQSDSIRLDLQLFEENPQLDQPLKEWAQTARTIKQAAHIVKLQQVVEAAQTLELYAQALLDQRVIKTASGQELCVKIVQLLADLSCIEPDHLSFFLQEKQELLAELHQKLSSLLAISPAANVKEELIVEELESENPDFVIDDAMFDLFRIEVETQSRVLNRGLIELEQNEDPILLEELMRAAHSIKGAARVVSLPSIVKMAHSMEDCFVSIQANQKALPVHMIDTLLQMVDLLSNLSRIRSSDIHNWLKGQLPLIEKKIKELEEIQKQEPVNARGAVALVSAFEGKGKESIGSSTVPYPLKEMKKSESIKPFQTGFSEERVLRVTAQNLNRLMGLAGESLVESRWLYPFWDNLQKLKKEQIEIANLLDGFRGGLADSRLDERMWQYLTDLQHRFNESRQLLTENLGELDSFIRRHANLSDRLYQEVINSRLRPFSDGVETFPRMVRDLARQLDKRVRLEIEGLSTLVDRDILEKLEAPLSHLLRNAIDHGIESPQERQKNEKPTEGLIKLKAYHRGGMLGITVSDDGRGIDVEELRKRIVEKNFTSSEMAKRLSESEVIDFLFLPGFSTAKEVTEISGRGIGLNIVRSAVQEVGGIVKTTLMPGKGTSFNLQLPLTLSVIRALLVEISGEAYAFPLARIDQALLINRDQIEMAENKQYFRYENQNIGLVSAWQVLELAEPQLTLNLLPVIILSERTNSYGLVVDRLIGEKELVVQELDARLGKVSDISAGALMEDGSPVLIIDVDDIVHSIDLLLSGAGVAKISYTKELPPDRIAKRVLVVDDSITVREVECRLLKNQGYEVETAVNGIDGWNAVRVGHYDLVITDIDMPRMNGIDLVRAIKNDPHLSDIPVMIVSYKEGETDRLMGLEAGADYYLTKSSFHDATLLAAVYDLIGKP